MYFPFLCGNPSVETPSQVKKKANLTEKLNPLFIVAAEPLPVSEVFLSRVEIIVYTECHII